MLLNVFVFLLFLDLIIIIRQKAISIDRFVEFEMPTARDLIFRVVRSDIQETMYYFESNVSLAKTWLHVQSIQERNRKFSFYHIQHLK